MSTTLPPERVRATISAYFAAIRALDSRAWAATFAPDGLSHDPVGAEPHSGRAQLMTFFEGIAGLYTQVDMREREVYLVPDGAAVHWSCDALSKSGQLVRFAGIDVFELDAEAQVRTLRAYWDPAAMMAQLGAGA